MNRIVIIIEGGELPLQKDISIFEREFDELVFVVLWQNFQTVVQRDWHPGNVLAETKQRLLQYCTRPFYLLPFDGQSLYSNQTMIRLSHFVPHFSHVATHIKVLCQTAKMMDYPSHLIDTQTIDSISNHNTIRRALFITRAQPFHNGHVEFIQQILRQNDEAIIAVACTEQALSSHNPATAGERMEMMGAYILPHFHKQIWIVPFSHTSYMMEKMKDILWLMPRISQIYSTNPVHIIMGEMEGLKTTIPTIQTSVRATEIRDRLINNESIKGMVPSETEKVIYDLNLDKRVQFLHNNAL